MSKSSYYEIILPLMLLSMLSACGPASEGAGHSVRSTNSSTPDNARLAEATRVELWATRYYLYAADANDTPNSIPLRGMDDRVIGPRLTPTDWCNAAIEGSVRVEGMTYNYAGVRDPAQTSCPAHRPSEKVRWTASEHEFGVGNSSNPLVPFRTIACDQGTVQRSETWLNGGFARFGQEVYIPAAEGAVLPDGSVHDGVFVCGDTGGLIFGNHIDVFVGSATGERDAARADPFDFIGSSPSSLFEAYILD
ncbi:3D domain-containing protein [Citreimonas salinaria]|uniref:3D domain-containing protein n=1 Tax=Citreimonas salinaria TaxID=321339 RepID=A0A1H3IQB5_9RHOB|nr:3D domain-containing protein [Citreimonas salinaria]SDY29797.1 3D domain-containing protein [Citreimonas salinaria]